VTAYTFSDTWHPMPNPALEIVGLHPTPDDLLSFPETELERQSSGTVASSETCFTHRYLTRHGMRFESVITAVA
jgi:hypothetical protein